MEIKFVRNATLLIHYAGKKFLIDPFFANKETMPPFANTANQDLLNPLVPLSASIEEMVDVDAVIVTHLHPDHFDEEAMKALPKDLLIYAQNEHDAEVIKDKGFNRVNVLQQDTQLGEIVLHKTNGQHGRGEVTKKTGIVSGVVLKNAKEKSLYIAGDTVWCDDVKEALNVYKPEVIIVNGGAAQYLEGGPITMDKEDIYETYKAAPDSHLIVCHMESLNHCLLTRKDLKRFISDKELTQSVSVPDDGETISI